MSSRLWALLGALLGVACAGSTPAARAPGDSASAPPRLPPGALAIRNVQVFDGERLLPPQMVVIADATIVYLGPERELPRDASAIDGTGKTLLPGLIDSHAHIWFASHLRQSAVFGVTTVLDMMDQPEGATALKKEAAGDPTLADLRIAGFAATVPRGHGTEYGFVVPTLTQPAEAQAFVDARIAEGSDYIKIIYDDGRPFGLQFPTLTRETMAAVITAAHARGKMAVVHISSRQAAAEAIEAGADGLAHTFEDVTPDEGVGRAAASQRTFVIPTLSVSMSVTGQSPGAELLGDSDLSGFLEPEATDGLKHSFPRRATSIVTYAHAEEAVRVFRAAGVPLLAGTDAPNPGTTYGASLDGELALLVKAGLTPTEALASATSVPARCFHLEDRGRIRQGLRADLLLVDGDPTTDIRAIRRISGVWVRGVRLDREAFRAAVAAKREEAARASAAIPAIAPGVISNFDDLSPKSRFGSGWVASTDAIAGGQSTASMRAVAPGARRTKGALLVTGEVAEGLPYAWAGAMFWPGSEPMAPVNLASAQRLAFWSKADGKTYRVLVFTRSRGRMPAVKTFTAPAKWTQFRFALADFEGTDAHEVTGIAIVAGPSPGPFRIQLDEVALE